MRSNFLNRKFVYLIADSKSLQKTVSEWLSFFESLRRTKSALWNKNGIRLLFSRVLRDYTPLCRSVGRSVGQLVGWLDGRSVPFWAAALKGPMTYVFTCAKMSPSSPSPLPPLSPPSRPLFQHWGSYPSFEAQILATKLKPQAWGPNPSFKVRIPSL